MKKSSLWLSVSGALLISAVLAGCGKTTYFAGRPLPPSGLINRVLIAIQNPSALTKGALQIVDGYYDIRSSYDGKTGSFSISGYSGALPVSIQNMPEELTGAVYGSGDGSFTSISYAKESTGGSQTGLNGASASIYTTRSQAYVFAASQVSHAFTVVDKSSGGTYGLSLPGVYRVSVNPGGTVAMAFVQNSNYAYFALKLSTSQTISFSGGPTTWPKAAIDCEPLNAPAWCLFQAQSPDNTDKYGIPYGAPLVFDRPIKAVFSGDGGTAYVLNCGPECGGNVASVALLPVNPMIFQVGQQSGQLPTNTALSADCRGAANLSACTIVIPGGSSNALVTGSTMYVVGQQPQMVSGQTLFTGNLTVLNLAGGSSSTITASNPASISDGAPGAPSRILQADDNTLWIGMTKCSNGVRYATGLPYGCLTMYDTSAGAVKLLEPFQGDLTGIADVEGLHKVYVAQGGQVHIYHTTDGSELDNQYVSVTGTAYDVAYMDAKSDANNTVY